MHYLSINKQLLYNKFFKIQMLKQEYLESKYDKKSSNQNQYLFSKAGKEGLHIKILVNDQTMVGQELMKIQPQEIDASQAVYQIFISAKDKNNIGLLRIFNGFTELEKNLLDSKNWSLDLKNNTFSILRNGKQIKSFPAIKNTLFDIFQYQDLINSMKNNQKTKQNDFEYFICKSFEILSSSSLKKSKIISRQQVQKSKLNRLKQIQKRLLLQRVAQESQIKEMKERKIAQEAILIKKQFLKKVQQIEVFKSIRNDTYGILDFYFEGSRITKDIDTEPDGERCIFGKNRMNYKNTFRIHINKLSKQTRNPAIWIGIADANYYNLKSMTKQMINIFLMSDQMKITQCDQLGKSKKICLKDIKGNFFGLLQYNQGDTISVTVDFGQNIISWTDQRGRELGSFKSDLLSSPDVDWVPMVQLWKVGDSITWLD